MASLVLLGASILALVIAVVCRRRRTRWTASQMTPEDVERVRQRLCDWAFRQGQEQGPALAAAPVAVVPAAAELPTPPLPLHDILLDLKLPDVGGGQFRRERQHDPALAPIPVVVVSGACHDPKRIPTRGDHR